MFLELTVNLSLPYSIADSPQAGDHEEHCRRFRIRCPNEEPNDKAEVKSCPHHQYGETSDVLHGWAEEQWAQRVDHSEADHYVAYGTDAERARNVGLEQNCTLLHTKILTNPVGNLPVEMDIAVTVKK